MTVNARTIMLLVLLPGLLPSCGVEQRAVRPMPTLPSDVATLSALLHDPDVDIRRRAAGALADLGPAAAPAVPDLIKALSDVREVRMLAADALGKIGPASAPAVPELTRLLADDWQGNRSAAAEALGNIGPAAAPAIPVLTTVLLTDKEATVRFYAALALAEFGPIARSSVPALAAALSDTETRVQAASAYALGKITGQPFPDMGGPGNAWRVDKNGQVPRVVAARRWWEAEGQYQNWMVPPTN